MADLHGVPGMVPYPLLFPESDEGVFGLTLPVKFGKAKAGEYVFIETYCIVKGCDCRRTTIIAADTKGKPLAVIDFGFDPELPQAGPALNDVEKQSSVAGDFLAIFTEVVNDEPRWLQAMHDHYRQVRRQVDGHAYRGRPFPKPGKVRREPVVSAPRSGKAARAPRKGRRDGGTASVTMAELVERYRQGGGKGRFAQHRELQNELARYLTEQPGAGDELAALLGRLAKEPEQHEELLDAGLRVLFDALEILRYQLEGQRPGAEERMRCWQEALALHVFAEGGEVDLCAAVTSTLLQARVEILPQLHEAGSRRVLGQGAELARAELSENGAVEGLFSAIEGMGVDSPFELLDGLLEMLAVGDAEVQVAMAAEMLGADSPLIRDTGALMLFHPQAEVRAGLAQRLGGIEGKAFTPATLRRLIVARNWFPEEVRGGIDQAIANARRARVECAPIPQGVAMTVYASGVDGAGAQSFQAIVPEGKGFVSCSLLLKMGVGVADAFLLPLENKRALREFLAVLVDEAAMVESTPAYLDLRVCQAVAEGARLGKAPKPWLVAIAERLGRDQWRATPFDPRRELAALRGELELSGSKFLAERAVREALAAATDWHDHESFAFSWFEDGAGVERDISAAAGKRKRAQPAQAEARLLGGVLQEHREAWLERLVLTTLWLKSAKNPPLPWPGMYHVAAALAEAERPLAEIPLMRSVAAATFMAYQARKDEGGW